MKKDEHQENTSTKKGFFQKRREGINRALGTSILKDAASSMSDIVRGLLAVPAVEKPESFEQAISRMHLSLQDLAQRRKRFMAQFFIFLICAFVLLGYGVYLFAELAIGPGIIVSLMVVVFVVYALRAHFWAFQIKHKKLGCTWQEWWNNKTEEEKQDLIKK